MVTVRRATPADAPRAALTITRAFADDPVMRWLVPDDDDYAASLPLMAGSMAARWLTTDTLWCTDDAVAVAGWVPPGRPEVDVPPAPIDHPDWRLARFRDLRTHQAANAPGDPHWYLNILATHPDWQRQGLGGALVSTVLARADADGLACSLETETPANVAYYRHHGFDVRSEWDLAADGVAGPHMWGMYRPAR